MFADTATEEATGKERKSRGKIDCRPAIAIIHREVDGPGPMPDVVSTASDDEVIVVTSSIVGCDGGGGALGHPLVYLRIEPEGEVVCPYCSRRFVLEGEPGTAASHH
jgi:uncharacterized Zn-finger protein